MTILWHTKSTESNKRGDCYLKKLGTVQRSVNLTKTRVCVDSVQNSEPIGFLYNPYMADRIAFFGYLSLINILDDFFDRMQCPQAYHQYRVWQTEKNNRKLPEKEVTQFMAEDVIHSKNGEKATFTIQVQFRQNATWQGTIAWMESKKIQQFRSALEMIKLMDNALSESGSGDDVNWE